MKFIYTVLFNLLIISSFGQTNTINGGDWTDGGNWDNGVPASDETVSVDHDMILDTDLTINDGTFTVSGSGSITDVAGGTEYGVEISGTGLFDVSGDVEIGGFFLARGFGELIVRGCDTLTIRGDLELRNTSTMTIESCAVLIVEGDVIIKNSNVSQIDGNLLVNGNLTTKNSAAVTGSGHVDVDGSTTISNSSSIFTSTTGCSPGPCEYGTGGSLPIELLDFTAYHLEESSILVEWETSSEINNDYFTIELLNLENQFVPIKIIQGAGNSNKVLKYKTIIEIAEPQIIYLRLRQTDFDGTTEVFNPIVVKSRKTVLRSEDFTVFPNPGNGKKVSFDLSELSSENIRIEIKNIQGKTLVEAYANPESDYQLNSLDLPVGLYVVSVETETNQFVKKYIVK